VNVVRQAGPRNVWMRSARPWVPSPRRRVDSSVSDAKVWAQVMRIGEAFCVHSLGCSSPAFHGSVKDVLALALALHPTRECRRGDRWGNRLGCAAVPETVELGAKLCCCSRWGWTRREPAKSTQQREREQKEEHEQVHMQVHEESSGLEMRSMDSSFLRRKNKGPREGKSSG
jgi:hypothetical protein